MSILVEFDGTAVSALAVRALTQEEIKAVVRVAPQKTPTYQVTTTENRKFLVTVKPQHLGPGGIVKEITVKSKSPIYAKYEVIVGNLSVQTLSQSSEQ